MKEYKILMSEDEYNAAVKRIIEIFDAEQGSVEFTELEMLLISVKKYENKYYNI
jgi:HTH-type transcriptional regulator/antitoxin HigA